MFTIRTLTVEDAEIIHKAFEEQGWDKPVELYKEYFKQQQEGRRLVLVAEFNEQFAGYITIVWKSGYVVFEEKNIPEIMDFNVLEKYQKQGMGKKLILAAEDEVKKVSQQVGLRVGLMEDYGKAQRLYIKNGYIPDGKGISKDNVFYTNGDETVVDHDLAIGLVKVLSE